MVPGTTRVTLEWMGRECTMGNQAVFLWARPNQFTPHADHL